MFRYLSTIFPVNSKHCYLLSQVCSVLASTHIPRDNFVCLERFSRRVLISDNSVNVMHGFDTQPLLGLHRQPQTPVWDMSISDCVVCGSLLIKTTVHCIKRCVTPCIAPNMALCCVAPCITSHPLMLSDIYVMLMGWWDILYNVYILSNFSKYTANGSYYAREISFRAKSWLV
jgi:hypothetical protein